MTIPLTRDKTTGKLVRCIDTGKLLRGGCCETPNPCTGGVPHNFCPAACGYVDEGGSLVPESVRVKISGIEVTDFPAYSLQMTGSYCDTILYERRYEFTFSGDEFDGEYDIPILWDGDDACSGYKDFEFEGSLKIWSVNNSPGGLPPSSNDWCLHPASTLYDEIEFTHFRVSIGTYVNPSTGYVNHTVSLQVRPDSGTGYTLFTGSSTPMDPEVAGLPCFVTDAFANSLQTEHNDCAYEGGGAVCEYVTWHPAWGGTARLLSKTGVLQLDFWLYSWGNFTWYSGYPIWIDLYIDCDVYQGSLWVLYKITYDGSEYFGEACTYPYSGKVYYASLTGATYESKPTGTFRVDILNIYHAGGTLKWNQEKDLVDSYKEGAVP